MPQLNTEFDRSTLTDEGLKALRAVGRTMRAKKLARWIYKWADREQALRAGGFRADKDHAIALPPDFDTWSDREIADALESAGDLTYAVRNIHLGEFADRLAGLFLMEAARRLRKEPFPCRKNS